MEQPISALDDQIPSRPSSYSSAFRSSGQCMAQRGCRVLNRLPQREKINLFFCYSTHKCIEYHVSHNQGSVIRKMKSDWEEFFNKKLIRNLEMYHVSCIIYPNMWRNLEQRSRSSESRGGPSIREYLRGQAATRVDFFN